MSTKYQSSSEVPLKDLITRLNQLSDAVVNDRDRVEFTMRIPAECDRDADLVISEAAVRLQRQDEQIKDCKAKLGLISIAADEDDMAKVKELIPPSCVDVVREIEQAAIESATFYYQEPKDNPSLSLSHLHPGKLSFVLENTKNNEWLSISVEVTKTPEEDKPIQRWKDVENFNNDMPCERFSEDEKNGIWIDHESLRESSYTLTPYDDALKFANDIRLKAAKRLHDLCNPEQEKE